MYKLIIFVFGFIVFNYNNLQSQTKTVTTGTVISFATNLNKDLIPVLIDTVVGQSHITDTLEHAIDNNQLAQALLFCGPRGVGKTTCARILARKIIMTYLYEKYIADYTAQSPSIMKEVQDVVIPHSALEQGEQSKIGRAHV